MVAKEPEANMGTLRPDQPLPAAMKQRAREMQTAPTPAERQFWWWLRHNRLGVRIRRQHVIGPAIADFFCTEAGLVIELDGGIHARQQAADGGRDAWMRAQGLDVIRLSNEEVVEAPAAALERVEAVLSWRLGERSLLHPQPLSQRERGVEKG
jgi:very-short-patch-repair endonuclease